MSQLFVRPGDNVDIGQKLLILEAMKMENEIASTTKGKIKEILVVEGERVSGDQVLMILEN